MSGRAWAPYRDVCQVGHGCPRGESADALEGCMSGRALVP